MKKEQSQTLSQVLKTTGLISKQDCTIEVIQQGHVYVNGKVQKNINYWVQIGDTIQLGRVGPKAAIC